MRITNKIMQRNNLANINTNKVYQDQLSTQMSTQKKISRASDDPVVAIRALRLRSNVTEVTQYYSKNIPDAKSWLDITEDALKNQSQVMTDMISQATKGSNGDLTSTDRGIILEQLQALSKEVYSTANADYAGRYVFTGFRTDTPVSFISATEKTYEIQEQLDRNALGTLTKVESGNVLDWTSENYDTLANADEQSVESVDVYRIQLAYKDCSETAPPTIRYRDTTGNLQELNATMVHSFATNPSPYKMAEMDADAVIYVPETGELLLGANQYQALMAIKDDITTVADEGQIQVTYRKDSWVAGDLRPEHYFYCKSDPDTADEIEYNNSSEDGGFEDQSIEYDVGFNQTIRVNSTAGECFQHGIGRTVDDLVTSLQEVSELEEMKAKIKKAMDDAAEGSDEEKTIRAQYEAADKALTLAKDKNQKLFEKSITTFQKYLDDVSLSITNCGNRSKKLELIENRMQDQKTTFENLRSENEDVDIAETAIQLTSAQLTYEAALMATGKVSQNSLLQYI